MIMHKWGYTGSACLPMALDDAVRSNRLESGALVVMTASGAGLAMGSVALRWNPRRNPPAIGPRPSWTTTSAG